jgi:hypothetical protein
MPKPRAPRQRVLKGAQILFGGAAIDCVVRNLSSTGAALDVESPLGIPPTFTLVVKQDGFAKQCRVAWRKEKRIGISFDGSDET